MHHASANLRDSYDVIIIGGGINGSSAAQNLAAAGYHCLVVDQEDFGSGASGRSARMLHIGLRFFEAEDPVRHFALNPGYFLNSLSGAKQAMQSVSDHLSSSGNLIMPYRMCFPIYRNGPFKTWHLRAGLRLLRILGKGRIALKPEFVKNNRNNSVPFFNDLRDLDELDCIACYNEFKFNWPERFCVDMLLDAKNNRATVLNYCSAKISDRDSNGNWNVSLEGAGSHGAIRCDVRAPVVLNFAGTWTDEIFPSKLPKPLVQKSKGSHIVVELPETYAGFGIAGLNKLGTPFYVLPHNLRKNHFSVGVTEVAFEGDARNVSCSEEEVDFLVEEFNTLLPNCPIKKNDVLSTWSGIRPLTPSEDGLETRSWTLHDLTTKGLPGVFALSGAPIISHRLTGRAILKAVSRQLKPSQEKGKVCHKPFEFSNNNHSPAFIDDEPDITEADLENSVTQELAQTLTDVLLRRTGLAWRRRLSPGEVEKAASIVGPLLGWSETEVARQVKDFLAFQTDVFRVPGEKNISKNTGKMVS